VWRDRSHTASQWRHHPTLAKASCLLTVRLAEIAQELLARKKAASQEKRRKMAIEDKKMSDQIMAEIRTRMVKDQKIKEKLVEATPSTCVNPESTLPCRGCTGGGCV